MFENMNQQFIADSFKRYILQTKDQQRARLEHLKAFERVNWYPQMFDRAVEESAGGQMTIQNDELVFDCPAEEARKIIALVVQHYIELVDREVVERIYGTKDAMQYISDKLTRQGYEMSIWGAKKYINRGDIPGQLVGKSLVFTQSALDKFIADYVAHPPKTGPKGPRMKKETTF